MPEAKAKSSPVAALATGGAAAGGGTGRRALENDIVALYRETAPDLLRYAERLSGDGDVAQEMVQEAFVRLFAARVRGQLAAVGRPWLFRVVRNLIFDHLKSGDRQAKRHATAGEASDLAASPESLVREAEMNQAIRRRLSRREYECLSLRLSGHSYQEIARDMGVEMGSVATFLARALKKLRREFADAPQCKEDDGPA